jgi:hypothetical protein
MIDARLRAVGMMLGAIALHTEPLYCQDTWIRTYAETGQLPTAVHETADRGFVVSIFEGGLLKVDSTGSVVWAKAWEPDNTGGWAWNTRGTYADGSIVVGSNSGQLWLGRFSSNGDVLWKRTYAHGSGTSGLDVDRFPDGGFVAVGRKTLDPVGALWVVRVDQKGEMLWERHFDNGDAAGTRVLAFRDGSTIVGGGAFLSGIRPWFLKLDPQGQVLWQRALDQGSFSVDSIALSGGGTFVAAFRCPDSVNTCVTRIDHDGTMTSVPFSVVLDQVYLGNTIRPSGDGGYVVIGSTTFGDSSDLLLVKLDSFGSIVWQRTYDVGVTDRGITVEPVRAGGYLVAGWTRTGDDVRIVLVKTDSEGHVEGGCHEGNWSAVSSDLEISLVETTAIGVSTGVVASGDHRPVSSVSPLVATVCGH